MESSKSIFACGFGDLVHPDFDIVKRGTRSTLEKLLRRKYELAKDLGVEQVWNCMR